MWSSYPSSHDDTFNNNGSNSDQDEFDRLEFTDGSGAEGGGSSSNSIQPPGPLDLYAVLNLEKTASDEDIRNSYRRLCMTFHPDKHQRPEDKAAAQKQFQHIQKAYDVLSNTERRYVYDTYGVEGLSQSWTVGSRHRTQEEMREEFDRMSRERLQADAENLIKSKGEIHVGLDVSHILDPYNKLSRRRRFGRMLPQTEEKSFWDKIKTPELTQAIVRHSWETKLAPQTDFTVLGSAVAKNGVGAASVQGTVRHILSPLAWAEATGTIGPAPQVSFKFVNNFTSDTFAQVSASTATLAHPPPLTLVLGRRLNKNYTGFMTFRTGSFALGPWGAAALTPSEAILAAAAAAGRTASSIRLGEPPQCGLGLVRKDSKSQLSVEVSAGLAISSASVGYFRLLPWGFRGRVSAALNTLSGLSGSISADRRVTRHDRLGVGVEFSNLGGVSFRIRFNRLGQKFSVPILLTPQLDWNLTIMATLIPIVTAVITERFVLVPQRKKKYRAKLQQIRLDNAEILTQRRTEALEAQFLMKEQVARKREAEEMKNGLVIVEAIYGKLPPSEFVRNIQLERGMSGLNTLLEMIDITSNSTTSGTHQETATPSFAKGGASVADLTDSERPSVAAERDLLSWIDVTVPVQGLVVGSQLHVSGGHSKSHIVGFYDPCLGELKRLRITYKFQGKLHCVEVDDNAPLAAPIRAHIMSDLQS